MYTVQLKKPGGAWEGDNLASIERDILKAYHECMADSIPDVEYIALGDEELPRMIVDAFQKGMLEDFTPNLYAFDEPRGSRPTGG